MMKVVPGRRVTLPPVLPPELGEPTLHSFYFALTASVYMAHFTLASGSRDTLGVRGPLLRDRVTSGG